MNIFYLEMLDNNEDVERINLIKAKVKYYSENKIKVHISCNDNNWYNGIITDVSSEFFIVDEEKVYGTLPVFYLEVKYITKFTKDRGNYDE